VVGDRVPKVGRDKGFDFASQANRRVVYSKLIATVRLTAWWGSDDLRQAKDRKYWMIVNILRHLHPQDSTWLDNLSENA